MDYKLKRKLKKFRNQARKLHEAKEDFLKSNKIKMNVKKGEHARSSLEGVDEYVLSHAFMVCRPFVMQNVINAESICEKIKNKTDYQEENINDFLSAWEDLFSGEINNGVKMKIGDKSKTNSKNFQIWRTEEYFHPEEYNVDDYKNEGLQQIKDSHPWLKGISKFQTINFLQKVFQLILWLDENVIQEILEKRNND